METRDESFFKMRDDLWPSHPAITTKAVIPTPPILRAYALVRKAARRHRESVAFWAHPVTGKTWCIRAMEALIHRDFPGCAVVTYEAKREEEESPFLEDFLSEIDYESPIARSRTGKRRQVERALYALGASASRIFIFIDEAQELRENELRWLKTVINWCVKRLTFVTIVLFGQQELIAVRDDIVANGRSDLDMRYTQTMYELENIRNRSELGEVLGAYDSDSEFPEGSGCSYTEFVWPRAFRNHLRLKAQNRPLWSAFEALSPSGNLAAGVSMNWIARAIAEVADATKDQDTSSFMLSEEAWRAAIIATGYVEHSPTLSKAHGRSRRTRNGTT